MSSTSRSRTPGAAYDYRTRTCRIDYEEPEPTWNAELSVGWHAGNLVHEATHGVIAARGIPYEGILRERIERVCVEDQNRFFDRLRQQGFAPAERLRRDFDATEWEFAWTASRWRRIAALFSRGRQ